MRILFIGDVVGRPGRDAIEGLLPRLREELEVDACIVNGENAADGIGITPRLADRILAAGADAITLGNHTWRRQEIAPYLAASTQVIRPANMPAASPGRGLTVVEGRNEDRASDVGRAHVSLVVTRRLPTRRRWPVRDGRGS
jgi:calcineurin-like phosphoesterase